MKFNIWVGCREEEEWVVEKNGGDFYGDYFFVYGKYDRGWSIWEFDVWYWVRYSWEVIFRWKIWRLRERWYGYDF